ncbi:MAG TPA: GDP-mannose 4,6-dehydratase [Aquella sp.]|nr:GDP-mannose 4,6-dehydratase [Aquella sp.]
MATCLITGGAGFIGVNLVEDLIKLTDWNIIILDRLDVVSNLQKLKEWEFNNRIRFIWWDLKSEINSGLRELLKNVNYIIHLAASSHVTKSIQNPELFLLDNALGTLHILNFARTINSLNRFYYQSTDEVMGSAINRTFLESDSTNPTNPYSAAKAAGESLVSAYSSTYKLPAIIGRCVNIYGKYQYHEKFIPLCIKYILEQKRIKIHSKYDISGSRYYLSTQALNEAILLLLKTTILDDRNQNIYNITSDNEISNLELANKIAKIMKKDFKHILINIDPDRPNHDHRYSLDGHKLRSLGWYGFYEDFDSKLEELVNWYLDHPAYLNLEL